MFLICFRCSTFSRHGDDDCVGTCAMLFFGMLDANKTVGLRVCIQPPYVHF